MNNAYNKILIDSLENISDWSSLKTRLEKYNTSQTETTRKKTIAGKIFEYFAKYYFLTEPEQTDLYQEAYLFEEIPLEISQKLKLPTVDHGIDILLKDKKGKYHAVQCKFKNNESQKLSWSGDKIANVFALGTHCDSIIVFTNVADVTNVAKNLGQYSQIAYDRLISIQPDVFENILLRAKSLKTKELVKYKPLEHQEIAINKVTEYFKSGDRGQLILPCGAGKTLAALWIKEKLMCKSTLVLLPSLALLKQIKNEWARHKNHQFDYICVCSEKDIDKDRIDTPKVNTYEIGGTVTTDSNLVTDFLNTDENKIVYSTYQSLKVIQDACTKNNGFSFSLTICDEAHRTAGSKNKNVYTLIHDNVKIPSDKRLYMTATPKVATTSLKTKLGDEYELLCDMSNPEIFGEEAHRMSFGEAIDKGILVDYKIIGIGVTDKQIKGFIEKQNYTAKWLSHQKILISRAELPKDKINILAAIGLNHQSIPKPKKKNKKNSANWDEMLEMLKEYHRIHGDFNVPKKYSINQTLSSWLYYQKTLKRTDKLEEDKIKALEDIGFEFPKPLENQKSWGERFEELLEYKAKNGDCQVPVRFKENQQLATWVRTQRRYFKEGTIDADKKQKLENIGFIWRVNN